MIPEGLKMPRLWETIMSTSCDAMKDFEVFVDSACRHIVACHGCSECHAPDMGIHYPGCVEIDRLKSRMMENIRKIMAIVDSA